ncbi:hypothetical protein T11_12573 [Trichinella zimbabwensis]|uniref:Uncharacterized protein n=1 Tax=Trichinella zimbabwensis TaxID=268475 RepID=A0A0V1HDH5_9BILA|nr:hypothetical protein T11_12573 [Trichinella zimbabwensis]
MVCFHMAVKDQCAASDRKQGNPECPELSVTSLIIHKRFLRMKYAGNPNKLKLTPVTSGA